ncbi:hypothetical protein C4N26_04530 [Faecalibacterium prausnitzii]|uniref:Uncharacterized protein n=1 Tax=Faecalibacterium prausnitzii TaxID=853 RepID=A0A329U1I8_9FIRM|nr:hypothetical protein C4N26_04530 [Faecalibacterium prausnitzii]
MVYRNLRSRVWGTARPKKNLSQGARNFQEFENLWPRDDSCSHRQNHPPCTRSHFVIQLSR